MLRFFEKTFPAAGLLYFAFMACSPASADGGADEAPTSTETSSEQSPRSGPSPSSPSNQSTPSLGAESPTGTQSPAAGRGSSEEPAAPGGLLGSNGSGSGSSGSSGGPSDSEKEPLEGEPTAQNPESSAGPIVPSVSGDCPRFATGTVSVGGLGGIQLQVGAKKEGTGSLVFYWHGTGSNAGEVNLLFPAQARQDILSNGGIIVSFGGSLRSGGDCSGTQTFSKDDFKVADQIAACAVRDHGIDPRRIYTTGCSAGGLQAGCMGALRSSYIAAVVPNSGGVVFPQTIQDPERVPAVMTMHGGTSDRVVVAFSQTSATYDQQMKGAGSFVVNCNHGGGHCQAPAALYTAGWEFMKAHPFGVDPEPFASGLPANFPNFCSAF
jgi:predicted esterase